MDLVLPDAAPTDDERAAVDGVLGAPTSGWAGGERTIEHEGRFARSGHEARSHRDLLLPALHALQARAGWISPGGLRYVSERLTVPPAEAYGVATFYAMFSTEPRPPTVVHVCDDIACRISGAEGLIEDLERELGDDDEVGVVRSPCLGLCERAPAVLLQRAGEDASNTTMGRATAAEIGPFLDGDHGSRVELGSSTGPPLEHARLLRRIGASVDPGSLDEYRAHGGYAALRRAAELGPEGVIAEVKDSKLLGRGGAAFPAGVKWEAVAKQPARPHYFICNADESEPGTFKDRVLMEQDPFAVARVPHDRRLRHRLGEGVHLHPRRVPARDLDARTRDRSGVRARVPRRRRDGGGVRVRRGAPSRRRRVHLRRGDVAVQLDRGQARRATEQATVPRRAGRLRSSPPGSTTSRRW